MLTRRRKRSRASATGPESTLSLMDINTDGIASVLSCAAMCCPAGARALALMARTCKMFGLKGQLDGKGKDSTSPSMVVHIARETCKEAGVRRLPLTMGDGWCWPRMLSWLSQAVRVGAKCELKTINDGVAAAWRKWVFDSVLVEDSVLVLVEPGVYEEEGLEVDDGQRVSIWRCDRESESNKKEMAKAEWRSRDTDTLSVVDSSVISVNGIHIVATRSEGYGDTEAGFVCVYAGSGGTLSLERCDLVNECREAAIIEAGESTAVVFGCCIHDGKGAGIHVCAGSKATLENNDIRCNALSGVTITDAGSVAVLRGNRVHDGKESGVWVCAGGFATLDNNDIYSNEHACVQIDDAGSEAILRSNRIYDGRTGGVLIANKGNGTLENNIIFNNAFCGIQVEDKGSQAMLKENRVHNGRAGGVLIYVEATATLERNIVTANDLAGVAVDEKSFARLVGNTITNNGACNNEWPDEDLAQWPAHYVSAFRSPDGFPGLMIMSHSTAVMDPGSNTIEGNGREGGSVHADLELQSKVDSTSRTVLPLRVSLRQSRKKNGVAS